VIAEGYTVAVSLAVQQDLFPRLTRAAADPEEFSRQVVEQIRLFITLYVPLALALMVLAVPVLTILFSGEFTPAQSFLRWRLAGDLFRIVGSVLTTSLLARALLGRRLVAEVGGSLLWFAGTLIGVTAFGFAGIGPFFVASTVGYVLILDRLTAGSLTRPHARRLREVVLAAGLALLIPCLLQEIASPRVAVVAAACLLVPVGAYSLRSLQRIRHGASGFRPAQSA
jgi:O-antigen/teichoic acid export membrane protein